MVVTMKQRLTLSLKTLRNLSLPFWAVPLLLGSFIAGCSTTDKSPQGTNVPTGA